MPGNAHEGEECQTEDTDTNNGPAFHTPQHLYLKVYMNRNRTIT